MIILFFDTETTGLINYKVDLLDASQPRIVQLAAAVTDEYGSILDQMDCIIKPDGWTISEDTVRIHGITTERAEAEGIPMREALLRFNAMKSICTHRAAYNISFDKQMMAREAGACGIPHDSTGIASICVMQMAKAYLNAKSIKLRDAYQAIMGKPMENAHSAMGDTKSAMDIYFKINSNKKAEAGNII